MTPLQKEVKNRCIINGECWEWTGAIQPHGSTPTMRWDHRVGGVRRFLAIDLEMDVTKKVVTHKCGNPACVNPDHIMVAKRRKLQQRIAKERNYQTNPLRMKRIADKARENSKLNLEIVNQIRLASKTQRQIAAEFGITQGTVSAIRSGRTWRDYSNPFTALVGALTR
jgi:HNH endonuclease